MSGLRLVVLSLLLAMTLLSLPAAAAAQQRPPHLFVGTAEVNGLPAPPGTLVEALIDGGVRASTLTGQNGLYHLTVDGSPGQVITFKVGSLTARQTATFEQGGADILNLTAGSDDEPLLGAMPGIADDTPDSAGTGTIARAALGLSIFAVIATCLLGFLYLRDRRSISR